MVEGLCNEGEGDLEGNEEEPERLTSLASVCHVPLVSVLRIVLVTAISSKVDRTSDQVASRWHPGEIMKLRIIFPDDRDELRTRQRQCRVRS